MFRFLVSVFILLLTNGCILESSSDLEVNNPYSLKNTLGVKLVGSEWKASNTSPVTGRINGHLIFGFKIFQRNVDGSERPYAAGITSNIEELKIEYDINREYRLEISSARISSDIDITRIGSIFNQSIGSVEELENFIIYYPALVSGILLVPYNTYINIDKTDPYFPSDKFVGEAIFSVTDEDYRVEVDMYRFSAGIGFRVLNLTSGKIKITFNLHQYSFDYLLDRERNQVSDIRPLYPIYSNNQIFQDNEFNIPMEFRQNYSVTVRLLEELNGQVEERILLNSEVHFRRNYMTTYELDMTSFYQNTENIEETVILDFVDTELEDRGIENF